MTPKISVFTTCKNSEKYFKETIDSVLNQTFQDFEIVIVDGASTDGTLSLIKEYSSRDPRIRWISEPDRDALEGFYKAIKLCRGEYIMCLPVSDFFLSKTWLQKCAEVLDSDIQVSMVHGCPVVVREDGTIEGVPFVDWLSNPLPSKQEFTKFYLATFCYVSELTYCIRRDVYLKCFPDIPEDAQLDFEMIGKDKITTELSDPFLIFLYNFFTQGYLAVYLSIFASAGRSHEDSRNNRFSKYLKLVGEQYTRLIVDFRMNLFSGKKTFVFRDGKSNVIKRIDKHELKKFKKDITCYRVKNLIMFNYQESLNVRLLRRIYLVYEASKISKYFSRFKRQFC